MAQYLGLTRMCSRRFMAARPVIVQPPQRAFALMSPTRAVFLWLTWFPAFHLHAQESAVNAFWLDSKLTLSMRNYAEHLDIDGKANRHAWVQGVRAEYESGFTRGPLGFGVDLSPFVALRLDGGNGARNMTHYEQDGSGQGDVAWGYLGAYALKIRNPVGVVKYGLQTVNNPFLAPYDIRALPPTFRGFSFDGVKAGGLQWTAGSFDGVVARGATQVTTLTTSTGAIAFDRFSYAGVEWNDDRFGQIALFAGHADDLWNQIYASWAYSVGDPQSFKWSGRVDTYLTRSTGGARQGDIANQASSLSTALQHGESSILLAYQQVFGDQFFDYIQETAGIQLANSAGADYNAPHEKSVQVRFSFGGRAFGYPGASVTLRYIRGWAADGSTGAERYTALGTPLHDLYWIGDKPMSGDHHEYGFTFRYRTQAGAFNGWTWQFSHTQHVATPYYSERTFRLNRILVNVPIQFL